MKEFLYDKLYNEVLNDRFNGIENEITETLLYYRESVIHYGEGVCHDYTFLLDELENYGEFELIQKIRDIVE